MRILVTGSSGLIGRTLCPYLTSAGHEVIPFDIMRALHEDVSVRDLVANQPWSSIEGVIHLAANAQVAACENEPLDAVETNVLGTFNIVDEMLAHTGRRWLLFASSREVCGPAGPVNVYGRTKAVGEDIVRGAEVLGIQAAIVRLPNVYGDTLDHPSRVMPAFARAAAYGSQVVVRGPGKILDFVHVSDISRGLSLVVNKLCDSPSAHSPSAILSPLHLAGQSPISLERLADIARRTAADIGRKLEIKVGESLPFESNAFIADPAEAFDRLGWRSEIRVEDGFARLVEALVAIGGAPVAS